MNLEQAVQSILMFADGMVSSEKILNEDEVPITKLDMVTILNDAVLQYENKIEEERQCLTRA